jgi:hypothetical protein
MKRGTLIVVGLFLMVFMTGGVNAKASVFFGTGNTNSEIDYNVTCSPFVEDTCSVDLSLRGTYRDNFDWGLNQQGTIFSGQGNDRNAIISISHLEFPKEWGKGVGLYSSGFIIRELNGNVIFVPLLTSGGYEYADGNLEYKINFIGIDTNNETYNGQIYILIGGYNPIYNASTNSLNFSGYWIRLDFNAFTMGRDNSERISNLESWRQTIDDWKTSLTTTISDILSSLTNHETRITNLESQNTTPLNITISDYWKYMSSGDRKNIVCGVATDNHLNTLTMQELGWKCDVTYRQTHSGEKASCRCSRL